MSISIGQIIIFLLILLFLFGKLGPNITKDIRSGFNHLKEVVRDLGDTSNRISSAEKSEIIAKESIDSETKKTDNPTKNQPQKKNGN